MNTLNPRNVRTRCIVLPCLAILLAVSVQHLVWAQEPLFGTTAGYYVGDGPCDVALADFNEDGHCDVAVSLQYPRTNNVVVLLSNGDGTFVHGGSCTAGNQPRRFATADFNADGHVDLAVTNPGSNNVSVLLGNGDGTFQTATNYGLGAMPLEGLTTADFDGDGALDLAATNYWSSNVSVLLGNGDGSFGAASHYAVGTFPRCLTAADFDEDGSADIAVTNTLGLGLSLLAGNGDGTFQTPVSSSLTGSPWIVATADFNHDGHTDMAVARHTLSLVSVLLGHGDGTFTASADYPVSSGPRWVTAADFDGDGTVDLAVPSLYEDCVSLLLGNGDGTFAYAPDHPIAVGQEPFGSGAADLDGDGYADLVVTEYLDDSITILLSDRQPACASVTYAGDVLVSTEGDPAAEVHLIAILCDGEGSLLEIDGEEVTFTLTTNGTGGISTSAVSDGGVAHAVEMLEPGTYAIEITLESFDATASAELVVYNPEAGFVTGGGWIACDDDSVDTRRPTRIRFGFNARYRRGQPRGHLQVGWSDRSIRLRSTSIELVIISDDGTAQFAGQARVNGEPGYWFSVTVVDNGQPGRGVDTFAIDIWAPEQSPDDAPAAAAGGILRGGNIRLHLKKPAPPTGMSGVKKGRR